jgi:hypothetical protein
MNDTRLITPSNDLFMDEDGKWAIKNTQYISDEFLDNNKRMRDVSSGDYHQVANIPCAIVDKWMREGFDIFNPSVKVQEIVSRLKKENLEAFITTNKRV